MAKNGSMIHMVCIFASLNFRPMYKKIPKIAILFYFLDLVKNVCYIDIISKI